MNSSRDENVEQILCSSRQKSAVAAYQALRLFKWPTIRDTKFIIKNYEKIFQFGNREENDWRNYIKYISL